MKKITKENKIFLSKEFEKDKYMYYGLFENETNKDIEIYSDEKNYIICVNNDNNELWIWTKEDNEKNALEIITNKNIFIKQNIKYKFICKKELYKILNKLLEEELTNYLEQNFLICKKLHKPDICLGYFDNATMIDKDIIAKYWYNAHLEMNGVIPISLQTSKTITEELIKNKSVYVIKNQNNKIVSIGYYIIKNDQAKIMGIYTHPEERRNNYAKGLVYNITNLIIKNGYIPTLYTDSNYLPSNKTYTSIGYIITGNLVSFIYSSK